MSAANVNDVQTRNHKGIEVYNLEKRFGDKVVLRGISFSWASGEVITLLGPNGAGKTTLLKILATLIRPSAGKVKIGGIDIDEDAVKVRSMIGMMSHQAYAYPALTGYENLLFYARMYNVADCAAKAKELLRQVGLSLYANDPVRSYSRGMLQRLSIARALIHQPDFLFLDEPYTGLDERAAELLTTMIQRAKAEGKTVLMVTHDFERGLEITDRVVIMSGGCIKYEGAAKNLDSSQLRKLFFYYTA